MEKNYQTYRPRVALGRRPSFGGSSKSCEVKEVQLKPSFRPDKEKKNYVYDIYIKTY